MKKHDLTHLEKTLKNIITPDMKIYGSMPVSSIPLTFYDESFTHSAMIADEIEIFFSKMIKSEDGNRVSVNRLMRMFLLYWHTRAMNCEEMKNVTDSELSLVFKRHIMANMQWVNHNNIMWLAHYRMRNSKTRYNKNMFKYSS